MYTFEQLKAMQYDYLGDGAYVAFDGHNYIIFTTDGISVQNQVAFEADMFKALNNFKKRMERTDLL